MKVQLTEKDIIIQSICNMLDRGETIEAGEVIMTVIIAYVGAIAQQDNWNKNTGFEIIDAFFEGVRDSYSVGFDEMKKGG